MPYRPYPNADRARRQVTRHRIEQLPPPSLMTLRLSEWVTRVMVAAHQDLRPFREMIEKLQAQDHRPNALYDPKSGRFALLDRPAADASR
ncbi:hypothetical protein ACFWNQ_25005 [Streptomyces virginiae]|uniref:hypothetical protein n=1 Tax=Streptomyces virginiae TaxID=1961 RepID=UPI0036462BAD